MFRRFGGREVCFWGVVLSLNALILSLIEDVLLAGLGLLLPAEHAHLLFLLGTLQLVLVIVVEQDGVILL